MPDQNFTEIPRRVESFSNRSNGNQIPVVMLTPVEIKKNGMSRRRFLGTSLVAAIALVGGVKAGAEAINEGNKISMVEMVDELYRSPGANADYYQTWFNSKFFGWMNEGKIKELGGTGDPLSVKVSIDFSRHNVELNITSAGTEILMQDFDRDEKHRKVTAEQLATFLKGDSKTYEISSLSFRMTYPPIDFKTSELSTNVNSKLGGDDLKCFMIKTYGFSLRDSVFHFPGQNEYKTSSLEHSLGEDFYIYNKADYRDEFIGLTDDDIDRLYKIAPEGWVRNFQSLFRDKKSNQFYRTNNNPTFDFEFSTTVQGISLEKEKDWNPIVNIYQQRLEKVKK